MSLFDLHQSVLEALPPLPPAPLPVPSPTKSFWLSPDANPLASEGSTGPLTEEADIVIIGSGITGVSTAYHLARALAGAKTRIVIVEARDFCSGATGRNGGHLTPNAFLHFVEHSQRHSVSEALKALTLEQYNVSSLLDIISTYGLGEYVDLVGGGHVDLLLTDAELKDAKADFEAAQKEGVDLSKVEWLSEVYMQEAFGTFHPAIRFPGHNLWPLKLVTKLYELAYSSSPAVSVNLHTHTPVTSIADGANQWVVHTPRGSIKTSYVVHATNAHASHLLPHLSGAIVPTRGQVIAIREYGARSGKARMEGWGANEGFEYWFPRPDLSGAQGADPLIILGGGREAATPQFEFGIADDSEVNPKVGEALRDFLPAVFAETGGKWEVEQEWSGIMGFTKLGDPFVGPVLDKDGRKETFKGQFISAGFAGHGMPRTFACAEVVSQLIAADLAGVGTEKWEAPSWLPTHYLTWNRVQKSGYCIVA